MGQRKRGRPVANANSKPVHAFFTGTRKSAVVDKANDVGDDSSGEDADLDSLLGGDAKKIFREKSVLGNSRGSRIK